VNARRNQPCIGNRKTINHFHFRNAGQLMGKPSIIFMLAMPDWGMKPATNCLIHIILISMESHATSPGLQTGEL
jgi:hypothetical protein